MSLELVERSSPPPGYTLRKDGHAELRGESGGRLDCTVGRVQLEIGCGWQGIVRGARKRREWGVRKKRESEGSAEEDKVRGAQRGGE